MELESLAVGLVAGTVASFFLRDRWLEMRIKRLESANNELEEALFSAQQRERGNLGIKAKQEKTERMQSAILEFATAMKEPNAKVEEVAKSLFSKYPDLGMDLLKKGFKI
jgi:predicted RNase H-like nuclease (RuvC/YqgF family)